MRDIIGRMRWGMRDIIGRMRVLFGVCGTLLEG